MSERTRQAMKVRCGPERERTCGTEKSLKRKTGQKVEVKSWDGVDGELENNPSPALQEGGYC